MSMKKGIFIIIGMIIFGMMTPRSFAVIFPDQEVVNAPSEDENSDSASRFGSFNVQQRRAQEMRARPMAPISDSSFEVEPSRAPASTGGRGPAGAKENTGAVIANSVSTSAKAIIRHAKKNSAVQEVALIASDLGFFPSHLFLTEGIPVRLYITGASLKSQCFMLDQFGVRRQIRNQRIEEVTFTPDQTGTFSFNCPMNGAKGTVVVKELEIAEQRMPASVETEEEPVNVSKMAKPKKSDITDDDFTPEFRN